ncbi:hypothetical protein LSTR_LSTR014802 [Laodelphax striatellus]|uniref:Uncharacterized protein n=1 Tax=Laodelphax striatellus TaxID=195883 RepID=A0A482WMZ3_LAOST|nr:hypothetical protein LSTR_LSTR014802 [Laodelphax striatellus]
MKCLTLCYCNPNLLTIFSPSMEHKHPYCRQIAAVQTRGWIIERVPMPNGDVLEDQAINPQKAVDRGSWQTQFSGGFKPSLTNELLFKHRYRLRPQVIYRPPKLV